MDPRGHHRRHPTARRPQHDRRRPADRGLPPARRVRGDRRPLPARRRPAGRRHRRRLVRDLPAARPPLRPRIRRSAERARERERARGARRGRRALDPYRVKGDDSPRGLAAVSTTCPYCGTGCGLVAEVRDGRLAAVRGDGEHPVNRGATCRKPTRLPEAVHAPDRATTPLWRASASDRWREGTWRTVLPSIAEKLRAVKPEEIAFYISGQLLTEDYYAVNKLAKGFLGTNNVDSNSRLCMSSAVAGYTGAFGSDGPPPSYADIDEADVLFVVGSNTSACHPIVWNRMRSRGAYLIVADPRRTPTAEHADLHLPVKPGTDLPLLNAMLHVLERDGLLDRTFLERHTRGVEDALTIAAEWTPARAAEVCGVPAEDIVAAARRFGSTKRAMALWSMGVNQSVVGTLKNRAILNLCLATGNIGRPGSGPLSLTGQPNAMGGRETGGLSGLLPGYRTVSSAEDRAEMARLWGSPGISTDP